MPTVYGTTCGVYTANKTAGTEVSSTYEGRYLTFLASELHGPNALIVKGDPVFLETLAGDIVGVAMHSQHATIDNLITIDTEGIWNLSVVATDAWGAGVAIVPGDALYIDHEDAVGTITRNHDPESNILFGYALGAVESTQTAVIAVKVHWAPHEDWVNWGGVTNYTTAIERSRLSISSDYTGSEWHNTMYLQVGALSTGTERPRINALFGHANLTGVQTSGGGWQRICGVLGYAQVPGTVYGSTTYICGVNGQCGGTTLTQVAHMCGGWFDFTGAVCPTTRNGGLAASQRGGAEILYLTNNSTTSIDSVFHVETFTSPTEYGIRNLFTFGNQCYGGGAVGNFIRDGGLVDATVQSGGTWKKIRIVIREAEATWNEYWLIAMTNPS